MGGGVGGGEKAEWRVGWQEDFPGPSDLEHLQVGTIHIATGKIIMFLVGSQGWTLRHCLQIIIYTLP